jgi:hypothetical protein
VIDAILPLLTGLGATADNVASTLHADGITGRLGATSFRNPIVRYINRHLDIGGYMEIPAGGRALTVTREMNRQPLDLPEAVSAFLDRFHAGEFPTLLDS